MEKNPNLTRSKVIATIGPASKSEETLTEMIKAGMDVARLNFSHGTHREHINQFNLIRSLADTAIMFDLSGPKIRTGEMEKGKDSVYLNVGDEFILTTRDLLGNEAITSVSYKDLPKDVKSGDRIFVNDGIIGLRVISVDETDIHCRVESGGILSEKKGVNIPDVRLQLDIPTEKDIKDLQLAIKLLPEYIAVSFVKIPEEILTIRDLLQDKGVDFPLIAKIEQSIGLKNFDAILEVSDGIMVARGDLGVEIPPERVPLVQKDIIHKCNRQGKPVITATQMLESMTSNPRPTRAEASDVANAVLDGTDAVMLSGETAVGDYPIESVATMERIVRNAEVSMPDRNPDYYDYGHEDVAEVIGHAIHTITKEIDVAAIITVTTGGFTARMISKYRPKKSIIAITQDERVMRRLKLLWGVYPLKKEIQTADASQMIYSALKAVYEENLLSKNDNVVIACGSVLVPGKTNLIGIYNIGDVLQL
ncbi:MAG: pyruvate kinase [Promethearchaeota archaeon]